MKQPNWLYYTYEEPKKVKLDPWGLWDYIIAAVLGGIVVAWIVLLVRIFV